VKRKPTPESDSDKSPATKRAEGKSKPRWVQRRRIGTDEIRVTYTPDPEREGSNLQDPSPEELMKVTADLRARAARQSAETGDLVLELCKWVYVREPSGEETTQFPKWIHPAVDALSHLAFFFTEKIARPHANGEAAALGHILRATYEAIERGDAAALHALDACARQWLPQFPPGMPWRDGYLPLVDRKGRARAASEISGGFYMLAGCIQDTIERSRAAGLTLDKGASAIGLCMAYNFPAIESLSHEGKLFERQAQIAERIAPVLRAEGERRRAESPETAAPDIAQALLQRELEACGKSARQIARLFNFRTRH
jgi:hypothetical protein